ncbi:hypothetical protein HYFRA_00002848 [Hymenoscyphus fraxineus]|uniref:Uncharacterized protein n=1 Tax=Hymenoscyphus fraxineus TaxID=746836 RepID=A0A9N9KMT1_9HELO|nr:hypothetical protein HYFRA_00002848 [Hymenoscyphus fraxineus]
MQKLLGVFTKQFPNRWDPAISPRIKVKSKVPLFFSISNLEKGYTLHLNFTPRRNSSEKEKVKKTDEG